MWVRIPPWVLEKDAKRPFLFQYLIKSYEIDCVKTQIFSYLIIKREIEMNIVEIERRFKEVSELDGDLSQYPLTSETHLQVKTNKEKSDQFGEVFTPLWLVDKMIEQKEDYTNLGNTLDMCAGYGQFTIRLIRKLMKVHGESFNLGEFFKKHWVCELQKESCYKLLYIFGKRLNVAVGDARNLETLPEDSKGIWHYDDMLNVWVDVTKKTHEFMRKHSTKSFKDFVKVIARKK